MSEYAKINRTSGALILLRNLTNPNLDNSKQEVWIPVVDVAAPSHDPATHKLLPDDKADPMPYSAAATKWVRGFVVVPKTAGEIKVDNISDLQRSGKGIALVLVELIDYLLANTAMTASDFTPNVQQAYQDIKAIADRVK